MSKFEYPEIGTDLWKEEVSWWGYLKYTYLVRREQRSNQRKKRKYCFHHDIGGNPANTRPAVSWIKQQLIETGKAKMFWCDEKQGGCGKTWVV